MLKQVSIIAENKLGSMRKMTKLISEAGIDFYNVVTNDSPEYGIVRVLCSDPEKAQLLLAKAGYLCKVNFVVGVAISEAVGSLDHLLADVSDSFINIDYMYVCYILHSSNPVAILHVQDYETVEECLRGKGYHVM